MRSNNKFISEDITKLLRELNIYEVDKKIVFPEEFMENETEGAFIHWDHSQKYLAYIPKSRFDRFNLDSYEDVYSSEKRKNLAVFNKSFRKVFRKCSISLTDESARILDGYFAKIQGDLKFEIVETPSQYYASSTNFEGNLGRSCMQGRPGVYFEIYDHEPSIKLLVVLKDNCMVGRALVFINAENTHFLDRRYAVNDNIEFALEQYGLKHGWYVKANNNMDDVTHWLHKDSSSHNTSVSIDIEKNDYKYYPYMDTFKYFTPDNYVIQTCENGAEYKLVSTSGDYDHINNSACDCCGDFSDDNNMYSAYDSNGNDQNVCYECRCDNYYSCAECEDLYDNEHGYTTHNNGSVCESCHDEHYRCCNECEESYHENDILYLEKCDIQLCEDCRGI
jgi:hypothetical protein